MNKLLLLPVVSWLGSLALTACASTAVDSVRPVGLTPKPDIVKQSVSITPEENKQFSESGDIVVPSAYRITVQGETEAVPFSGVETILEVLPTEEPDSNPILVAAYPANPQPEDLVPGNFFWQSYSPGMPTADEHFSQLTVNGDQVRMEVNPSETPRSDVMWFTETTGTLTEMPEIPGMPEQPRRIGATPQSGTLTFQVEGSGITGEIDLVGMSDIGTVSTYQATFSGQAL